MNPFDEARKVSVATGVMLGAMVLGLTAGLMYVLHTIFFGAGLH